MWERGTPGLTLRSSKCALRGNPRLGRLSANPVLVAVQGLPLPRQRRSAARERDLLADGGAGVQILPMGHPSPVAHPKLHAWALSKASPVGMPRDSSLPHPFGESTSPQRRGSWHVLGDRCLGHKAGFNRRRAAEYAEPSPQEEFRPAAGHSSPELSSGWHVASPFITPGAARKGLPSWWPRGDHRGHGSPVRGPGARPSPSDPQVLPWRVGTCRCNALVRKTSSRAASLASRHQRPSRLHVWWIKLGISPELILPTRPEQNGRQERVHRTLKDATARPPSANLRSQKRGFDRFRSEFNLERPHEALGQNPPADFCHRFPRPLPRKIPDILFPPPFEVRRVSHDGGVRWSSGWATSVTCCLKSMWASGFTAPMFLGRFDECIFKLFGSYPSNMPL